MLDIQSLRSDLENVAKRLSARGFELDVTHFQELEQDRKLTQTRTQELQARRNATSKQIGQAKAKGEDVGAIMAEVAKRHGATISLDEGCDRKGTLITVRFPHHGT